MTVLHLAGEEGTDVHWNDLPAGVTQVTAPAISRQHHDWPRSLVLDESLQVLEFLIHTSWDFVHYQDWQGAAFTALQYRETLGLPGQPSFIVTVHGGMERAAEEAGHFPQGSLENVIQAHAERQSAAMADLAILPDATFAAWLETHGWQLPARHFMLPLFPPHDAHGSPLEGAATAWNSEILPLFHSPRAPAPEDPPAPSVAICIPSYNMGGYLAETLSCLEDQTAAPSQVIVVDDGSTDDASIREFDRLAAVYATKGWTFLRTRNQGPEAARNEAARLATTDCLLFVDADNLPLPGMVEVFTRAMARTGADVVSSYFLAFEDGSSPPESGVFAQYRAVGPCLEAAVLNNVLGDANVIIRRELFLSMGGFAVDRVASFEDWELLARCVRAGHHLAVVPRPLFLYRHRAESSSRTKPGHLNHARGLRALQQDLAPWVQRALSAWFGSEGPFKEDHTARITQLAKQVSRLQEKLTKLEQKHHLAQARLQASRDEIRRLRESDGMLARLKCWLFRQR